MMATPTPQGLTVVSSLSYVSRREEGLVTKIQSTVTRAREDNTTVTRHGEFYFTDEMTVFQVS
jgi:hypothetical protein